MKCRLGAPRAAAQSNRPFGLQLPIYPSRNVQDGPGRSDRWYCCEGVVDSALACFAAARKLERKLWRMAFARMLSAAPAGTSSDHKTLHLARKPHKAPRRLQGVPRSAKVPRGA